MTRRSFFRATAAVGATLASAGLPGAIRRALATTANNTTKSIRDVQHIVILMQENRSFDHYFGTMKGVRGFGDRLPIPLASGKPVWFQSDGSREIPPFHLDMTRMNAIKTPTNSHNFADAQAAWNQGKFGFWPKYKLNLTTGRSDGQSMGYYARQELPFQFALAESFTLCDHYHCSVHGGTDPNRIAFWSGSNIDPAVRARGVNATSGTAEVENYRCLVSGAFPVPGYTYNGSALNWQTIPDVLQQAGVTWRIYQDPNSNWAGLMHGGLAFASFRNAAPGSPLYQNGLSAHSIADLAADAAQGTLPAVSWILPSPAVSEHPAGSSPRAAANFIEQILNALTANPDTWSRTALFITFDENDGFFDHLPPPAVPSLNADGTPAGLSTLDVAGMYFDASADNEHVIPVIDAGVAKAVPSRYIDSRDDVSGLARPYGMGPRVPMYVVSPWSKGGWVCSQVFSHASMGMFIEKRFGVTVAAISPWDRAIAGDLTTCFDFITPNDPVFPALPDTGTYAAVDTQQAAQPAATPPAAPTTLMQEAGSRPSRALPYELHVSARVGSNGRVTLLFSNTGMQGAVFHVYDRLHLDRIPRRYTVEAGKQLSDSFWDTLAKDAGRYSLWVYAPNGFLRTFEGDATQDPGAVELQVCYDIANGVVVAKLVNGKSTDATVLISANAYRQDGPWSLALPAGGVGQQSWDLGPSGNWYDFTVGAGQGFQRRFAGRVETGQPGVSDPAMGAAVVSN